MTYRKSIDYLSTLIDYERWLHRKYEFKLNNYCDFLESIGNPHRNLKRVVLVAGTKGKGSTATMLASLLKAHGENVGLYTSPHLLDYRERIKVNGRMIPEKEFAGLLFELKPKIEMHEPRITFFEALTTIALLYFVQKNTSANVLEIGLGGRLDATNVTAPELSIITRIGYDHTHMLGKTLGSIANEKCGILRKGRHAVISAQRPGVTRTIKRIADEKGALGVWWSEDFSATQLDESRRRLKFKYEGINIQGCFSMPVVGKHQIENAAAALAAAELLVPVIEKSSVSKALSAIRLPARIEIVSESPLIILDMSHNPESALTLRKVLDRHFESHNRRILLIGTTQQKDKRAILTNLADFFTEITVTQANVHRAEPLGKLMSLCRKYHLNCKPADSIAEGMERIIPAMNGNDLLVISGSIYVAGEALEFLKAGKGTNLR